MEPIAQRSPQEAPSAPLATAAPPSELSLQDALWVAIQMQRTGQFDDADTLYRRILSVDSRQVDALHFLGVLKHQRGESQLAVKLIQEAIALAPSAPAPWNNLANVYVECGRVDDAAEAYAHCLMLAPDFADAHNNVGTIHRLREEWVPAEASYLRAVECHPDFPDAYNNLSKLMIAQGRTRDAVLYACKTITLLPHDPEAHRLMGFAFYTLGETDKAADIFRQWLANEPSHPVALHHLAACTGQDVPARASDEYVATTFDAFAASFDAKLAILGYRAPQVVADALRDVFGPVERSLTICDAGCGTGLCGPLMRDRARELVGVDLSDRMLDRARARGVYDRLDRAELLAYLGGQPDRFDAIVAADTLCYFGPLEAFSGVASSALRGGGALLFTVEAIDEMGIDGMATSAEGAGHVLGPHGRYAHRAAYVRRCLETAGFDDMALTAEVLRREGGRDVDGWMVRARKGHRASGTAAH